MRRNAVEFALLVLMPAGRGRGVRGRVLHARRAPVHRRIRPLRVPRDRPLAVLVVASLHAFGRRWVLQAGVVLLVAMVALSYAGQLVTLTGFYA